MSDRMNDNLNGLIYQGKVYFAQKYDFTESVYKCLVCSLYLECFKKNELIPCCSSQFGEANDDEFIYKFSQKLTDKLNGK